MRMYRMRLGSKSYYYTTWGRGTIQGVFYDLKKQVEEEAYMSTDPFYPPSADEVDNCATFDKCFQLSNDDAVKLGIAPINKPPRMIHGVFRADEREFKLVQAFKAGLI